MKKIIPIFVLVVIVAVAVYFIQSGTLSPKTDDKAKTAKQEESASQDGATFDDARISNDEAGTEDEDADDEDYEEYDDRPAAEIYKTKEEALRAIEEGAKDYDDIILEQFTEPGPDCTWCPEFYTEVTDRMLAPETDEDTRSYLAEVLAISGKEEHVRTLVKSIEEANNADNADIYAEALELTIGGDEVVNYLAGFVDSDNELLQESSVAAITNQGSRLAAETLYKHTVEKGDPDGYYSLGIGLAELIPEEETLPYLNELVTKRDQYSHLAVKSLLNYGLDGLKLVFDSLSNSKDPAFDKKMLEDAIDHVSYEEEVEAYLKKVVESSKQPIVVEFAKEALEDFNLDDDILDDEDAF